MTNTITIINRTLNNKLRKYLFFIFLIIILTTILEMLSLASFYPLIEMIIGNLGTNDNSILKANYVSFLEYLNLEKDFYLTFTILLVGTIFISKILILLFCNWHSANFEFAIRFFLTKKLYNSYINKDYKSLMK